MHGIVAWFTRHPKARNIVVVAIIVFGGSLSVAAQTGNLAKPESATPQTTTESPAHKYFTDVVLLNQNGERMRLYSDLLHGKVVIINSFFATCQGSCLPMNRNLETVQ